MTVNAFYRYGSTAEDYANYNSGLDGNAYMYTTTGGVTTEVPVALLSSGACEDNGYTGVANIEGTDY